MKKIKIFLASSEDLKEEALELSDLVEHLNLILENHDIHIYLDRWEYLDNERGSEEQGDKRDCYESKLDQTDILIAVFGRELGSFTEKELKQAYNRLHRDGLNPAKVYVYFKSLEGLKEDLRIFQDTFSENYGQIAGIFQDANILKNEFLLQFQVFQNSKFKNAFPIKITDSKVTLNGEDLAIDFSSLPYVCNVSRLNGMKAELENIELLMECLSPEEKLYSENAQKKNKLLEEKEKLESKLWETAVKIEEFKEFPISNKLKRAIKLFENGEIERILEIIDSDEIKEEARQNLRKMQDGKRQKEEGARIILEGSRLLEEGIEGLKNNIRELELAIKAEEINMIEGWGDRVLAHHENIISYTREIYGEKSKELVNVILVSLDSFSKFREIDRAIFLCELALEISKTINGDTHIDTANCYIILSELHEEMRSPGLIKKSLWDNRALKYGARATKIVKNILGEKSLVTSFFYSHLSRILAKEIFTYPGLAEEYAFKALKIRKSLINGVNSDIVNSYMDLGYIYTKLWDYDKALKYIKRALCIHRQINIEENLETANIYHNLGSIYSRNEQYDDALDNIFHSYAIHKKLLGKYHPCVFTDLISLKCIYLKIGKYDLALDSIIKALEINTKIHEVENLEIAYYFNEVSELYSKLGNYNEALSYLFKSLKITQNEFDADSDQIQHIYEKIASLFNLIGDYKKALKYELKALKILKKDELEYIKSNFYYRIGELYRHLKEFRISLEYVKKALKIRIEEYAQQTEYNESNDIPINWGRDLIDPYYSVALSYSALGEYETGLNYLDQGYEKSKETKLKNRRAIYLHVKGQIYDIMGEKEKAGDLFREALKLLPEDHPDAIDSKERLNELENIN